MVFKERDFPKVVRAAEDFLRTDSFTKREVEDCRTAPSVFLEAFVAAYESSWEQELAWDISDERREMVPQEEVYRFRQVWLDELQRPRPFLLPSPWRFLLPLRARKQCDQRSRELFDQIVVKAGHHIRESE